MSIDELDDVNDEMFGEDEEDEEIDFDHLAPEDGSQYEFEVRSVLFSRDPKKDDDSITNLALRVQIQLKSDDEFNNMMISEYIWLGRNTGGNDQFMPAGRKKMLSLMDAVGLGLGGQIKMSQLGAQPGTVGKVSGKLLTAFTGQRGGVILSTTEETIGDNEQLVCKPRAYITLEKLDEIRSVDTKEPGF